jgi:hypothetical protein
MYVVRGPTVRTEMLYARLRCTQHAIVMDYLYSWADYKCQLRVEYDKSISPRSHGAWMAPLQ